MAVPVLTDDLWKRLAEALGLTTDADAETLVLTVEDVVTAPEPKPEDIAAAAGLDPATLTQLRHDAEQGRVLAAAARRREITDKVSTAVRRGAIAPARVQHWTTAIESDPTMADTLASLPDQFAVPLASIGHSDDPGGDLVEQAAWFN